MRLYSVLWTAVLILQTQFLWSGDLYSSPVSRSQLGDVHKIFSTIGSEEIMKADFEQIKTVQSLGMSFSARGTLLFSAENGIAWLFTEPFVSSTVITGSEMIQIDSRGNRTQVISGENELFTRFSGTVQSLFLGDYPLIEEEYEIFFQGDSSEWVIGLVPRNSLLNEIVGSFELTGKDVIESFIIRESTGDLLEYRFSSFQFPSQLSEADGNVFP